MREACVLGVPLLQKLFSLLLTEEVNPKEQDSCLGPPSFLSGVNEDGHGVEMFRKDVDAYLFQEIRSHFVSESCLSLTETSRNVSLYNEKDLFDAAWSRIGFLQELLLHAFICEILGARTMMAGDEAVGLGREYWLS
jgi:hypothetical protein